MADRRNVPLLDLGAELRRLEGLGLCLVFDCPVCGRHAHAVPYLVGVPEPGPTETGGKRWGHVSGSTIADLTLTPSYVGKSEACTLHCHIRKGVVEILADSHAANGRAR